MKFNFKIGWMLIMLLVLTLSTNFIHQKEISFEDIDDDVGLSFSITDDIQLPQIYVVKDILYPAEKETGDNQWLVSNDEAITIIDTFGTLQGKNKNYNNYNYKRIVLYNKNIPTSNNLFRIDRVKFV